MILDRHGQILNIFGQRRQFSFINLFKIVASNSNGRNRFQPQAHSDDVTTNALCGRATYQDLKLDSSVFTLSVGDRPHSVVRLIRLSLNEHSLNTLTHAASQAPVFRDVRVGICSAVK